MNSPVIFCDEDICLSQLFTRYKSWLGQLPCLPVMVRLLTNRQQSNNDQHIKNSDSSLFEFKGLISPADIMVSSIHYYYY